MFSQIRKKIAFKLACVILLVVAIIGTAAMGVMVRENKAALTQYLNLSLSDAVTFSEMAYSGPLWASNGEDISRLNRIVLKNRSVVAVNIYDMDSFVCGAENRISEDGSGENKANVNDLEEPYTLSENNRDLKRIPGDILRSGTPIGRFEIFYTERFIDQAVHRFNRKMLGSYLVIGALNTVSVLFVVITTLTRPIIELARIVRELTQSKDFSMPIRRKKRQDEIGTLFNGFVDMVSQIQVSQGEREDLQREMAKNIARCREVFHALEAAVDNGAYTHRITPGSGDDDLVPSLNKMLETLEDADILTKNRNWIKNGQAELSNIIGGEQRIATLADKAVNFIAAYSGAHVGTLFIQDDKTGTFYLAASYAFRERKGFANRFKPGQGLPGQAVLEKTTILYTHVPKDYMQIESSLGHAVPHAVVVIPLVYEGDVKGVIELGSIDTFSATTMAFLESVADTLAVAVNAAMFNNQLSALLGQTKAQAETLKSQQEELRASNEALEEKTGILEAQKTEIEKKNKSLVDKQKEIKEKAEQLKVETKYKSQFLANMSHELRTPLNSILILARMLAENDEQTLTGDQIESAASIYRSGQNLLHLINNILDLSKIDAGKIELSLSRIGIAELGKNAESEFMHMAKQKNLDFVVIVEEDLPESIVTDVHRLGQIIRNLVGNALKFTEQGSVTLHFGRIPPDVTLSGPVSGHEDGIAISVIDTGEGIPENKIALVFEAFKQVDGSISRRHGGTGLGLSISRELAALLGGEIKAASVLGRGSTFTIYIPVRLARDPAPGTSAPPPEPGGGPERSVPEPARNPAGALDGKKVLVVDDDMRNAFALNKFLKSKGMVVSIAGNGEKALAVLDAQAPPDIVLMDIMMPVMDGYEAIKQIRTQKQFKDLPVIALTAKAMSQDEERCIACGANGYLSKPLDTSKLLTMLGAWLC